MRHFNILLLTVALMITMGCTLGKKGWPEAVDSEDGFALEVLMAERKDNCLSIKLGVTGASERLYRASIQFEKVDGPEGGCINCPFVPRSAKHVTRDSSEFILSGDTLNLSLCGLESGVEYRFRVAGKNELPSTPLVFTSVYVTGP